MPAPTRGCEVPDLKPTYALTAGKLISTTDNPAGGPQRFVVERDMDVPADALRFFLMDRSGVGLGDDVKLELGHDGAQKTVFTGTVCAVRPAVHPSFPGTEVCALGKMAALLDLYVADYYENQAAGSIASDLVRRAGLSTGTVDDGPTMPWYAVDSARSAFAHLGDLAARLGFELFAGRDGKVMFRGLGAGANLDAAGGGLAGIAGAAAAGELAAAAGSLLGLGGGQGYAFGKNILRADGRVVNPGWASVKVGGESPMSGKGRSTSHWLSVNDADYRGEAGDGNPALLSIDPAARTKELADRFARGRLVTAARRGHEIRFRALGRPDIELGDDLSTAGMPDKLSEGQGYVRAMRHSFDAWTGFVTEFRICVGG
jgi:hypothetical protein